MDNVESKKFYIRWTNQMNWKEIFVDAWISKGVLKRYNDERLRQLDDMMMMMTKELHKLVSQKKNKRMIFFCYNFIVRLILYD